MSDPISPQPKRAVFHERRTYRQRRVMDAARFLPVLGMFLWLVPLLWPSAGPDGLNASTALIYIFVIWAILVGMSALLSFGLRETPTHPGDPTE